MMKEIPVCNPMFYKRKSEAEKSVPALYSHEMLVHVLKLLSDKPFRPNFTSFTVDHVHFPLFFAIVFIFNLTWIGLLSVKLIHCTGFDLLVDDYISYILNVYIIPLDAIQRFTAYSLLCVQYPQIRRNGCKCQILCLRIICNSLQLSPLHQILILHFTVW